MTTQANNSGAVDIELSVDDVKTIAPEQIVMIHDHLRRSRADLKEDLEHARGATERAQQEAARMQSGWQACQKRVQYLEARLARVAVNLIDNGALEELLSEEDL